MLKAAASWAMPEYPNKLPGFSFRQPDEESDAKILANIHEHGWHVVMVPDDEEGPGFAFTVGVYLRTLYPEILLMGVPMEPAHRILNAIAEYLVEGGAIIPGQRYPNFVDGLEVLFLPIHRTQFHEYLGCANWFYKPLKQPFPAYQCFWPDLHGQFPHEEGFDERFHGRQIDLSLPRE